MTGQEFLSGFFIEEVHYREKVISSNHYFLWFISVATTHLRTPDSQPASDRTFGGVFLHFCSNHFCLLVREESLRHCSSESFLRMLSPLYGRLVDTLVHPA